MEAVLDRNFVNGYSETKKNLYDELKSRTNTVILNSIKGYLREKGIQFDGSSIDLKEFKNTTVSKLDKKTQLEIANLENSLNKELETVVEELKNGSQSAFGKFANRIGNIGKSSTEMIARATAIRTAAILSPTLGTVALGASIAVPAVIRAVKGIKSKSENDVQAALDVMIIKLTTVKDGNNTRFDISPNIMQTVSDNLKSEGVNINKEDPTMFIRDLSRLDNVKKEHALNTINNLKGNIFDVDKELKNIKINLKNIKEAVEKNVVAPISTAAMVGLVTSGTLNDVAGDAIPSVITALGVGAATGNVAVALGAGGTQYGASKFLTGVPWIGNAIEKVNQIETTAATTGTVIAATIALKVIPGLVYKGAKGIYKQIKNRKAAKDSKELLDEQFSNKMNKAQEDVKDEIANRSDKDIMLDIVRDVLKERGVDIPKNVNTSEQLKTYLKNLDGNDKKQIYKVASILEDVKDDSNKSLKKTLGKVAKTAYWGGVIALAGLGAYDMFINPGFLDGLKMKSELERTIDDIQASSDPTKIRYTDDGEILTIDEKGGTVIEIGDDITSENISDKIIEAVKKDAEEKYIKAVDQFREHLPESELQVDNFMEPEGSLWNRASTLPSRREVVEVLDLDNPEGLDKFFQTIDPNDENLKFIMEKVGAKSVDELANNNKFITSLFDLTGIEDYSNFPEYFENIDSSAGGIWDSFKYGVATNKDVKDAFVNLINDSVKKTLSEIPTQDATLEEIIKFANDLANNSEKMDLLSKYMQVMDVKDTNVIVQNMKNSLDFIKEKVTGIDGTEVSRVENLKILNENLSNIDAKAQAIEEAVKKQAGIKAAANSTMTTNPYEITGMGAATGVTIATVDALTEKRKGVFSRMKAFIADKLFPGKKKKALPAPSSDKDEFNNFSESENNKIDNEENYKFDVKVNPEDLKSLEHSSKKTHTKNNDGR